MTDEVTPSGPDPAAFRTVMGTFATGVTVVTADAEGPLGFTCQSFVSLSIEPPLVALAPARSSTSWPRMRQAGAFCINVLSRGQEALAQAFARSGGDKFAEVDWVPGPFGAPHLQGCLSWVDCRLEVAHDAGDHELVVGRVLGLAQGGGSPLLFYRSRFAGLVDPLQPGSGG